MTIDEIRAELKAYQEKEARLEERARVLGEQAREAQKAYQEFTTSDRVASLRSLKWALEGLGAEL